MRWEGTWRGVGEYGAVKRDWEWWEGIGRCVEGQREVYRGGEGQCEVGTDSERWGRTGSGENG